jgi:hypothetical protein
MNFREFHDWSDPSKVGGALKMNIRRRVHTIQENNLRHTLHLADNADRRRILVIVGFLLR